MIEIIPAIDLIDGRCVRLTRGDFEQKTEYSDDPVATAQKFEQCGVRRLHVVDLDGARTRRPVNLHVLEAIAKSTTLVIDYGGGLASEMHIQSAFDAGAAIVNIGSVAVTEPELLAGWVKQARAERTQGKSGLMKEEREELARLRKENRELRIERDLLNKVSALFARHQA